MSHHIGSFAVSNTAACRFIRLTQTGENEDDNDQLGMRAFEVFGRILAFPVSPRLMPPPSKSQKEARFPLTKAKRSDGIISYLTRKHGGNVHDKGIVTITSKSVYSDDDDVRNVADLTDYSFFRSKSEPDQWVCWDFHEMRVRPTHYTIESRWLKSWVVESSLDSEAWTEIDRKTDNQDFNGWGNTASFAVSNSAECRFIRLTETGKRHAGTDFLYIRAFEVFGTLLE
jgi:hypothetical protein